MKILLTSDNHLGYKETDNILGNDSFNTFEEILQIANTLEVDLMLQGGDLFHCNNPSKNTLIKTINLLKKYCLGNKSINYTSNNLNINDANLNIALPVVAIHGNHDDPSGVFIQSAYDILQSTGYINYIGKTSTIEYLNVTPTIIEGDKKVAIFGIGNIKDRVLYKLFEQNKVKFNRPENYKDYVNILVVHQNRVQRSCKDYLPIEFVDDWFDLVIYGHEHDSMIFPVESKGFTVIQSGSTVRTSLCDAEVGDKYCYLLEIQDTVKINRIKLNTVRNFITKTIKVEENLESTLKYEIDKMIENETCPLIRLRIDFDGEKINKRKFGLPYKDRVANYADMISFVNKKKLVVGEKIEKKEMKDVLNMFMEKIDLKAIPESLFIDGVRKFAENGDKEIFSTIVNSTVLNSVKHLKNDILDRDTIERKITFLKDEVNKENNYVKKKDEPHQFDLNKR